MYPLTAPATLTNQTRHETMNTNFTCYSGMLSEQLRNMLGESEQTEDLATRLGTLERTSARIEEMLERLCGGNERDEDEESEL